MTQWKLEPLDDWKVVPAQKKEDMRRREARNRKDEQSGKRGTEGDAGGGGQRDQHEPYRRDNSDHRSGR